MHSPDFKVLIVGGGSCGLTLAQGLQKAGVSYILCEKDLEDDYYQRPRDWGSLLHWGQEHLRACLPLDIWERRAELYVDPYDDYESHCAGLIWNGKTGEEIKQIPSSATTVRVSRKKIRLLLSKGLKIEFNKTLEHVTSEKSSVTAHFRDGSSVTGNLLVGCDGGRSKTREYIVGAEAARGFDTGYTVINTWKTLPAQTALALRAKHPIVSQAQHPDGVPGLLVAMLDNPSPDSRPETWKFQVYAGWRGAPLKSDFSTNEKTVQFYKSIFRQFTEPFYSVGETFSTHDVLPVDDMWNFKPTGDFNWNNFQGKVTIAGDAAHSMLPHRGQGLNNAIMDSARLLEAVKKVVIDGNELEEVINEYEHDMRSRGTAEVELSYAQMLSASKQEWKDSPMFNIGLNKV